MNKSLNTVITTYAEACMLQLAQELEGELTEETSKKILEILERNKFGLKV